IVARGELIRYHMRHYGTNPAIVAHVRLRMPLRSQMRTANDANANGAANDAASLPANEPDTEGAQPGWLARRRQARTASAAAADGPAGQPAKPEAPSGPSLRVRLGSWRRRVERDRSRWARRALDWPLVNWLEGTVWVLVALTLASSYYGSYGNLVGVLMAVG